MDAQEAEEAVPWLRAALRLDAWNATTHTSLGAAYAKLGDSGSARRAYRAALSLAPASRDAGDGLWTLLDGDAEAAAAAASALAADAGASWAAARLAQRHEAAGRFDAAVPLLQAQLRAEPQNTGAWAAIARCYSATGKVTAARRALGRAVELSPGDDDAGAALCALLDAAGEGAAADTAALAAFERAPDARWAAARCAAVCSREGRHSDALPALQALLRRDPENAARWEALGACYAALGRPSAAAKAHARALALAPSAAERPLSAVLAAALALAHGGSLAAEQAAVVARAATGDHPVALLTASAAALTAARDAFRAGAHSRAASALHRAREAAAGAAAARGTSGAAWKALGDALTAHRDVTPLAHVAGARDQLSAYAARRRACLQGGAAYAHRVHLTPCVGAAWRDLAAARCAAVHACWPADQASAASLTAASRAARAGLRVEPACAALWSTLAAAVTEPAAAESALCHALQLEPQMPRSSAALGRLYLGADAADASVVRAAALLESARASEASDAGAWLSTALMFEAEGNRSQAVGALRRSVAAGGDPEADLRLALLLCNDAGGAEAFAPALRAAATLVLQPEAHAAFGRCLQSRGLYAEAAEAFERAATLHGDSGAPLRAAAAAARAAAASHARVAHGLHTARVALGKQLVQEVQTPAVFSPLAHHGVCAAALQAVMARCSPEDRETCAALLAQNGASALLKRHTAHALPTLPACVLASDAAAPDGSSPWARLAQLHAAALSRARPVEAQQGDDVAL
jgi:tetratricopeptide (TPR) repeat protein